MIYHLCLGANTIEPDVQISRAIAEICSLSGINLLRKSSLIKSAPYGKTDQADFFNQVLEISTDIPPSDLLSLLLDIESKMGRIRTEKWGERLIDIDILLAENLVIDTSKYEALNNQPELIIPHPDFQNREFALQLLNELIPEFVHPVMHKTISELYFLKRNSGGKP